tara:strand:+ start:1484 stop:3460 length:1977 start_codon:yes stop_codon:yes gene_type:complete
MFKSLKDISQKAGFNISNIEKSYNDFLTNSINNNSKTYIRFSSLLEFLEKTQLIYTKQNAPLINFDYEIGKSYMITNKWVISPNPNILLINPGTVSLSDELRNLKTTYGVTNLKGGLGGALELLTQFDFSGFKQNKATTFNILDSLPKFKLADDGFNSEIGDIMNIYLEVNKVFDILLENTNEKGKVSIFKFLDSICSVINNTLGNLSSIAPFIDESTNTLSIIEEGELPHKDKLLNKLNKNKINVPLQLYGYSNINTTNPTSSFVKSFNLKTEITNDLATMVTIGAQASGEIVKGIDATAFASWNRGLIDRIIPVKKPTPITSNGDFEASFTSTEKERIKVFELFEKYETGLSNYVTMLDDYSNNDFEEEDVSSFTSGLKAIIDYNKELIKLEIKTVVTQPGFLPINLNLTLDGISGPTILQQFEAEGRFLPHPIPDTLTFLIKGLNHKISNNVWTTTIESLSVPKFVKSSTTSNNTPSAGSPKTSSNYRKTAYPELPFTDPRPPSNQMSYEYAVTTLKSKYGDSLAKAVFAVMFAEASKSGEKFNSAGGHNYAGVQTDNSQWGGPKVIIGQYAREDSVRWRSFAMFESDATFLDFMASRIEKKKFDGDDGDKWVERYLNSWVFLNLKGKDPEKYKKLFPFKKNIYNTAMKKYEKYA